MKILVISKSCSLVEHVTQVTGNHGVTVVRVTKPSEAESHLTASNDYKLVIVSMDCTRGGSEKWKSLIAACAKRQPCVFIPDTCDISTISGAILNNQIVFPIETPAGRKAFSILINGIARSFSGKQPEPEVDSIAPADNSIPHTPKFTRRQKEVLKLMVAGKSNREIAVELNLAEGTVKLHTISIYRSLGVSNRVQAVLRGQQLV